MRMSKEEKPEGFENHGFGTEQLPTALTHLYRAQVGRADSWRTRLDACTNWAVVTAGATLTMTFGEPNASHLVIPLCSILVTLFWVIEARRYRYYELWSSRVRHLESNYFANLLQPENQRDDRWVAELVQSLREPRFPISSLEALGRRYRRVYVWLHCVLGLSWLVNLWIHPRPLNSLSAALNRPVIGDTPAWVLLLVGFFFHTALFFLAFRTRRLKLAEGEVL